MSGLRPIDVFQVVTSSLLLALGAITAVRAFMYGLWFGVVVGAVMAGYGIYRWRFIIRALREVRR
jgi:hypothetical protein